MRDDLVDGLKEEIMAKEREKFEEKKMMEILDENRKLM